MNPNVKGKRIAAVILDSIFQGFLTLLFYIIALISGINLDFDSIYEFLIYISIIPAVTLFLYYTLIPYFLKGSTFGKLLLSIRVVSFDFQKASFLQLLIRNVRFFIAILTSVIPYVLYFAFQTSFVLFLGIFGSFLNFGAQLTIFIMILSNDEERGFHDMIANTYVVDRSFDIAKANQVNALERQTMNWAIFEDDANPTNNGIPNQQDEDDIEILRKD